MSAAKFLLCVVVLAASCVGQSSGTPAKKSGCLQSLNGQFVLITTNGNRIVLKGDHDTMLGYTGKQVKVTGTMKAEKKDSSKAPEMHVTSVKKLADVCQ